MKDNLRNDRRDDQTNRDQDQFRENTMNETIRETSGDSDRNLNDIRRNEDEHEENDLDRGQRSARRELRDTDISQGMSYSPNDTSGVRSGGISDMDDQTAGGAGASRSRRKGSGTNLRPKTGTTGSDYDGQSPAI